MRSLILNPAKDRIFIFFLSGDPRKRLRSIGPSGQNRLHSFPRVVPLFYSSIRPQESPHLFFELLDSLPVAADYAVETH